MGDVGDKGVYVAAARFVVAVDVVAGAVAVEDDDVDVGSVCDVSGGGSDGGGSDGGGTGWE